MSSASSNNTDNLTRLIWLRLIVLACEALAVWQAQTRWGFTLPQPSLTGAMGFMFLISLLSFWRLRFSRPVSDAELFGQLTLDVLVLTALLYFSGGSTNPFAPFYLLPLTLTAAALPGLYTWGIAGLAVLCYSLLLFFYVPLPEMHHGHGFRLHVLGMWVGFLLSALLIAGFAVRMAAAVRERERMIAEMREQQLRHEQVLALGTLAAGAAHELGTPLSTMAVVLKDLSPDTGVSSAKLSILRGQILRCKEILGSLTAAAGGARAEAGSVAQLDTYLENLLRYWQVQRPGIQVQTKFQGLRPAPRIVVDQTLEQAILNICHNAADASPEQVEIRAEWTAERLILEIADRGQGLAQEAAAQAGVMPVSTKQDGLGLGLFLSYTTLQRLGGEVRLLERDGGGVLCRIDLPLISLQVIND
ncbi:MAG: HAMP domain-containing histidine kinase [Gammaproteobacteria bacterium]|nr:HAMP domain-containing histidine kinase [Gammaproteobacteria bacterium]